MTTTTQTSTDTAGLVADGMLDLDAVFDRADWREDDGIASYTACAFGADGEEPGEMQIVLESASRYGITAYRWAECDDSGRYEVGPITLDPDEAITGGEEYASDNDELPDADELIARIVASGYFGAADADDIRAICHEATMYPEGYFLLPRGEFVGYPIGRMWTLNGYLQCEYVTLDANYPNIAYAADALLRAIDFAETRQ